MNSFHDIFIIFSFSDTICSERYRERGGPGVIKPLIEMLQKETSLKIVAAEALCNISNNNGK